MAELFTAYPVNRRHDPRMLRAGDRAELVDRRAWDLAKATLSDGAIDRVQLPLIGATDDETDALEREGLWAPSADGWVVADFLTFNSSRAEITKRRERENDRKKQWRDQKNATPDAPAVATRDATRDETVAPDPDSEENHRERETRSEREESATRDATEDTPSRDEVVYHALALLTPADEVPDVIALVRARGYTDVEITDALNACEYPSQLKRALPTKSAPTREPLRPTIPTHARCAKCGDLAIQDQCACWPDAPTILVTSSSAQ